MSRSDDIRRALQQHGEPMFPREIAEAMGADDRRERASVAAQVSEMANQGHGVERMDDGRYSLIPGWSKGRRSEGGAKPRPAPVADPGPERPRVADAKPTAAQIAAITNAEIPAGAVTDELLAELRESASITTGVVLEVPPAGTSSGTAAAANQVAARIADYLAGDADHNLVQLLRDAREEIMQLDCAARMALASAEQLTEQLRAATR